LAKKGRRKGNTVLYFAYFTVGKKRKGEKKEGNVSKW